MAYPRETARLWSQAVHVPLPRSIDRSIDSTSLSVQIEARGHHPSTKLLTRVTWASSPKGLCGRLLADGVPYVRRLFGSGKGNLNRVLSLQRVGRKVGLGPRRLHMSYRGIHVLSILGPRMAHAFPTNKVGWTSSVQVLAMNPHVDSQGRAAQTDI